MLVFKNVATETTSITQQLTIFGKTFADIKKDLHNGLGIKSFSSTVTSKDVENLRNFNKQINNGVKYKTAFNENLSSSSIIVKRQANELIGLNKQLKTLQTLYSQGNINQSEYRTQVQATQEKITALTTQTQTLTLKQRLLAGATQTVAMAFNMLKMIAVTAVISAIIAGITKLVNKISDLANNVSKTKEKVSELTDEFKSALSTANTNADKTEELISKYQQLSKGVNDLGENVALTNEEYTEYNSLVNEIAEMFPELVRGYTDEGNAILNLKGNVEKLRDAYKEAQQEAYNLLIASGENGDGNDIIKQWQDTQDTNFWASFFDLGADDVGGGISVSDAIDQLKAIQDMSAEEYKQLIATTSATGDSDAISQLTDIEKEIGYGDYLTKALGLTWDISDEDFTEAKKQAKILVQTYNSEIQSALSDVKSLANAYLMTNEDYDKLDSSSKNAASIIVNSLNENIASGFNDKTDVGEYVQTIVDAFENSDSKNAINNLFNLDTSNMSVKDINAEVDKYIDIIAKAIGEDSDKLKIRLGFEDINDTLERAKRKFQTGITFGSVPSDVYNAQISSFLEKLTPADLDIAMQIPDLFADGLEKASEKIQEFKSDPNNKIGISFDYSSYSEQVDDVVKNVDKVQSALDKLNSGKGIDNKDITELANAFPDYSSKILSAADNTEKLTSVLSEIKSNAPSGLINTLRNLKDLSADDQDAVNGLIAILSNLNSTSSKYADTLADLETKEGLLSTAYKEMHDDGQISLSTYQKLIDSGIDYSKAIENVNGKIIVNSEKLKELTKTKYNDEIQTLELAKAEIGRNMASDPKYYMEQIDAINDDIKAKKEAMKLLDAYDYTTTANKGKTEEPQSVLNFEKELAEKQHEINMGQREENEDYYSWLLSAAHTAYDGLADYQDDLWKYEEKVYEWRKKNEQDLFDQKIENAKTLADKILDDKVEVPEEAKKLAEFNKKMQKEYGLGNVDLTKRPKVSADAMRKAGYDAEDGETATVYSSFDFLWQGDEEHGKYVAVHYTPILPDGTVLDEKTLNDYLNTLVGSDDILKADTKGIILKVDSDVDVSDTDVKSLETDKPTENIQNITKACDDWDIALHEVQAEWLDLSDAAEKAGTTAANKWDYAREIVNGYITDTQNRIKELENSGGKDNKDKIKSLKKDLESYKDDLDEIDEKEIKFNVEQTKKDLKKIDKEIEKIENDSITSDGTKLFGKEKWDTIESMYVSAAQKVQDQIDAIVKSGVKGNEDLLEELGETLDDYGDKIAELPKSAAKEEQEYLKNQKEKASKQIDEEINAVQKKIDALKKVNEKEQEALDIEKARKELEKASQSTRQVYGADGSISFKVDDEKVKEAQENLDKILLEQQTSILEEQKDLLETEKDNSEKRFDILLDVLDEYLNPDQGESNSDVWKELAHTEGATYKNGVWTDKDGKAIDINKLLETSETAKKEDNLGVGKKPDDSKDALKGSLRKDNNKDDVIRGHLTRQNIGNETSDVKDVADTTGSVVESFFSNLEKKLGLKDGSLSLDKVSDVLNGSNKMGYSPYANMTERVGTVGSEYTNANNVNNNNAANITIGDIVINNPVGNSDDLAKELRANLHNAADRIIYSNLR